AVGLDVTHPLDTVTKEEIGAGVTIGFTQLREVFFRHAGYPLVDFHLPGFFHTRVLEHFFQGAAVATAHNHHFFRVFVSEQGRVGHHLVVQKVVPGGEHHAADDYHQVAECIAYVDFHLLKRILFHDDL